MCVFVFVIVCCVFGCVRVFVYCARIVVRCAFWLSAFRLLSLLLVLCMRVSYVVVLRLLLLLRSMRLMVLFHVAVDLEVCC